MADSGRGTIRIKVDGAWGIDDLLTLAESLSETYGYFYPLVCEDDEVRARLHDTIRQQFWTGDINTRQFGRHLYRQIPKADELRIKSFHYSSPGALELAGMLGALALAATVALKWISVAEKLVDLFHKIDLYFLQRKNLVRPKSQFALDRDMELNSDGAKELVIELGESLGFDEPAIDRLIAVVGNPISTLKFMVALTKEGRKLAEMQNAGLLELPDLGTEGVTIQAPLTTRSQRVVTTRRKRRKPKKLRD